jgi:hypothetical protein
MEPLGKPKSQRFTNKIALRANPKRGLLLSGAAKTQQYRLASKGSNPFSDRLFIAE